MKSKISLIIRILLYILVSVIIGTQIYFLNAKLIVGDPYPTPFGYGAGVVSSGSMEPTYKVNDIVISKEQDSYQVGQVVVYLSDGKYPVVHRIISIDDKSDLFQTQGDANNAADQKQPLSFIKGAVVTSITNGGGVLDIIKSPITAVILILGLFALIWAVGRAERKAEEASQNEVRDEILRLKKELEIKNRSLEEIKKDKNRKEV